MKLTMTDASTGVKNIPHAVKLSMNSEAISGGGSKAWCSGNLYEYSSTSQQYSVQAPFTYQIRMERPNRLSSRRKDVISRELTANQFTYDCRKASIFGNTTLLLRR